MDIISMLIILAIGGVLGWKYREYTAMKMVEEMKANAKILEENKVSVTLEKSHGQVFAYCSDKGDFLAQADNWDDLAKRLVERFPGKKFIMDQDNLKEVGYYK